MFSVVVVLVAACDILREDYYQRTGKSEGTLVATVGMSLEEVQQRSTLKLAETFQYPSGESLKASQAVFDLDIFGTGLRLERCRYYWLHTRKHDSRLDDIAIYVTPPTLSPTQLAAAEQELRQKLKANGWLPGRFISGRTAEQPQDGAGNYWLKNNVLFILESRQMDEQKPGADRESARFLQSIKLLSFNQSEYPYLEFPGQQVPPAIAPKTGEGKRASP